MRTIQILSVPVDQFETRERLARDVAGPELIDVMLAVGR